MTPAERLAANNLRATGLPVTRRSWRAAREVLAEADALTCHACNGRTGPCTCGRACKCRHPLAAHEHLRRRGGTDCVSCPEGECSRYRRQRRFRLRA